MDAERHPAGDQDGRAILTVALVVLAGVTGAAFGRVFEGSPPTARLVLLGAGATLLAALLQRRHLAVSLLVSAAALTAAVALLVWPETTWHGLPTLSTWDAFLRALGELGERASEEVAPAPPLPALFSAAVIAVWASATAAHALAARARSTVLSLAPPASLVAFASVAADDGARFAYAAVFLLAALGVLFASGTMELQAWGPVLPRRSYAALRIATGPAGRAARRVGLAAVAAAVLAPGLLPGFRADPLVDLDGPGERIAISPLVDIRPNLLRTPAVELFTVRAERPAYWRLLSLDEYTGRFWKPSNPEAAGAPLVEERTVLGSPLSPGTELLTQEFTVSRLGGVALPAAFLPVRIHVPGQTLRHDTDATLFAVPSGLPAGLRYSVTSATPAPSPEDLDRQFDFDRVAVPSRYTQLPPETPVEIYEVARRITADEPTPYRKALAIQDLLRSFTYDEQAPAGHGIDDLLFFLQSRRGYCEQFAGTMAVLLRALGYPARVAIGFLPGTRDDRGIWHVTTEEAHSWVEMYFPRIGWLAFEPTPTRSNPVANVYLSPPVPAAGSGTVNQGLDALVGSIGSGGGPRGGRGGRLDAIEARLQALDDLPFDEFARLEEPGRGEAAEARGVPWARIGLGLLVALLLLAAAGPTARTVARRLRLRRARTPRARVIASYHLFEASAADLGLGRHPGETLGEYADRLRREVRFSDGHLGRLVRLADAALYGEAPPGPTDPHDALVAARALAGDVRRHVGRLRALARLVRPASS